MARPANKGLHYFAVDVDFFDDERIMLLMNRFGPVGCTVYSALLTAIYKEGYFLRFSSKDMLALRIIRLIGSKWLAEPEQFSEILGYCGELGLFDNELLSQGVITSAAIQRRYKEATARTKIRHDEYWLLPADEETSGRSAADRAKKYSEPADETSQPDNNMDYVAETPVCATQTPDFAAETPLNKIKQNKTKRDEKSVGCAHTHAPAQKYRRYGRFRNIRLTDAEYEALGNEVRNRDELIERVSVWMKGHGKHPADCYARLLQWESEDIAKAQQQDKSVHTGSFASGSSGSRSKPSYDIEAFAQGGFDLPDEYLLPPETPDGVKQSG